MKDQNYGYGKEQVALLAGILTPEEERQTYVPSERMRQSVERFRSEKEEILRREREAAKAKEAA